MSTSSSHNGKVIITCAITGSIHTPSMSPYLPITPNDIVDAGVEAAEAGAAILHLHARDPETGRPDQRPEAFAPFLARVKQATNAVVNLTSGGSPFMTIEERIEPSVRFKPELASLNMGSMNFGLFPMLNRYKDFKHEWERPYLESTRDLVFRNTFKDIEFAVTALSSSGTRFEFECYDVGHLYNLAHFAERKLIEPPFLVQSVFGILGGIGTHAEDVMHMRRTADRLFGADYRWSVLGAGRMQMPIAAMAASMGAPMCASASKTVCGSAGVNLPAATPSRSAVCAASSRGLASRRPRRTRRAISCISKGLTRCRSKTSR
jgi:3,5-dioxohexanoate:acetyl-CoA acetone transferase